MPSSNVDFVINESIAVVTVNRPEARNAFTWDMYLALAGMFDTVAADERVRVLIIRGSDGAFSAGTDISHFKNFVDADSGIVYERRLEQLIDRLEQLPVATIAEVDGAAAGGGCAIAMAIAMACDLRICSDRAKFGVPVARTLGNCLAIGNTARLIDLVGPTLAREMLLTGRMIDAREATTAGLATMVVPWPMLQQEVWRLATELSTRARSTIVATKAIMLQLRDHRRPPMGADDDVIRECYASQEFREGVEAFLAGRKPNWY
jgi:enoyl-CoA hydratase/carnithine racemase